jgi:hypothetical protein
MGKLLKWLLAALAFKPTHRHFCETCVTEFACECPEPGYEVKACFLDEL